jgi:hypothetical protein
MAEVERFFMLCLREGLRKVGGTDYDDYDYEVMVQLFEQAGGSWEDLALSNPQAWTLLKKCLRTYLQSRK